MNKTTNIVEIKQRIKELKDLLGDKPLDHIKKGTWFPKILQMVLYQHAKKVNAEYFKRKYVGLDNERIAYRLTQTCSDVASIAGGLAAAVVSGAELAAFVSGGWTLTAAAASLIGEISYITYIQLELIYDISIILDAELDKDDPEDIVTIFWLALGVNIWEDISNLVLKTGPRTAEYLGRKALRSGIRKAMQNIVVKFGGRKLAQKITEKALLRLIVPGVNIPIAAIINKRFTKSLGKKAIQNLKHRGVAVKSTKKLMKYDRHFQIISIPIIYHVGIFDDKKDNKSKVIEMQNTITRLLKIQEGEEQIIDDLISLSFEEFCALLKQVNQKEVAKALLEISIYSYILSEAKNNKKLNQISESLDVKFSSKKLNEYKRNFD